MKTLLLLAAVLLFTVPSAALADTLTFSPPVTAANNSATTNNPNNSNYNGGANQFDLDHHFAYTWQINNVNLPAGQSITGATITFKNIANWDTNTNRLYVHLFNTALNAGNNQVANIMDASGAPVTVLSDYFTIAGNSLEVAGGAGDTFLFDRAFNMVGQNGYTAAVDYVYTFTAAQLSDLAAYIAAGNNIAFGFDPDCHYWNNGITFQITTSPATVPEPATLALLGTGLMSTGFYLRRRRQTKGKNQE